MSVAVVLDHSDHARSLRIEALTRAGLHVEMVVDVDDAVRVCNRQAPAVVIIADGPGLDAVEACWRVRAGASCDSSSVLLIGPAGDDSRHRLALAAGADVSLPPGVTPLVVAAQAQALVRGRSASRRLQQERLQQSEERLQLAIEATELGVFDYDPQSGTLVWSPFARRHFGLSQDADVSFDTFLNGLHPADRPRVERIVRGALDPASGGEYVTEYRTLGRDDGEERWLSARGRVLFDEHGRPTRFIGVTQDVTSRKAAEAALRRANEELREASRRKDEFIAILSHELRNPLAPIRMALPLLGRQALAGPAARAADVIDRQVNHLTRLLDDLLDVSRISRGKLELRPQRTTISAIVKAAVEAASPLVIAGRHELRVRMLDDPVWVRGDLARLTQVVTNLINNSATCTPRGGFIEIEAGREGSRAYVRIRDNGIGIPPQALPDLFEMFRQVKRVDQPQGGLGIGLALSRRLVEMHGGTIDAESAGVGRGAEFIVRLPLAEEIGLAQPVLSHASPGQEQLRVLIVDDNQDLVEMLSAIVTDLGHDVRKALDGASALDEALSYHPDLVLLDLGLPVLSGIDVAKELRRRPETAGVCLVAITGWGAPEDRLRTREAGFNYHLTKPVDPEHLLQVIAQCG